MIVVDTSVLLAILQAEPEAYRFTQILSEAHLVYLPASVLVEAGILSINRGLFNDFQELIGVLSAELVSLDETIAHIASEAHRVYGKGRHKAGLNFGDCIVYATAKYLNVPLLFKGNDFSHTDIATVMR
jgi:ribonuclease VapC